MVPHAKDTKRQIEITADDGRGGEVTDQRQLLEEAAGAGWTPPGPDYLSSYSISKTTYQRSQEETLRCTIYQWSSTESLIDTP